VLAGLCLAVAPAAASADSIVFVKAGNVWLAKPDGSGAYQVTTDGTPGSPYVRHQLAHAAVRRLRLAGEHPRRRRRDLAPPRPSAGGSSGGGTPTTAGTRAKPGTQSGGVTVGPLATTTTLRVKKLKLAKALHSGLDLTLNGAWPGRQALTAKRGRKLVARGTAKVGANGTAAVTLRFRFKITFRSEGV
jgi:hypothetical protein